MKVLIRPRKYPVRWCGECMCKSLDAVWYSFSLTCANQQPLRTVTTVRREIQTSREGEGTESILPIGICPTLYINLGAVNTNWTSFYSVVVFLLTSSLAHRSEPIQYLLVICIHSLPWLTEFCMLIPSPRITGSNVKINMGQVINTIISCPCLDVRRFVLTTASAIANRI